MYARVFFFISIFSMTATTKQPWNLTTDSVENNLKAKNAYTALLTVTAKQPEDEEYMAFSEEVMTNFADLFFDSKS